MSEICQCYNSGNKRWVKMDRESGRILQNAKEKFEDVPVYGEQELHASDKTPGENGHPVDEPAPQAKDLETDVEQDKSEASENNSESGWGFFEF